MTAKVHTTEADPFTRRGEAPSVGGAALPPARGKETERLNSVMCRECDRHHITPAGVRRYGPGSGVPAAAAPRMRPRRGRRHLGGRRRPARGGC
jgi:hypothetical protein